MEQEKKILVKKKKRKARISDIILRSLIYLFSFLTIGALAALLIFILSNGLSKISWDFLTGSYSALHKEMGIFPFIISTLYLIGLTVLIACPIGVLAAVFLVEYARPGKLLTVITFATETLAGIPSIIYGLFGFIFFVTLMGWSYSLLSCAMTLSIMILPTIIRTTQESLKAVPVSFREASLALGATKLETVFKIVLPSAVPGIISAIILSIGRIVGETAAVMLTFGMVARMPEGIFDPGRTLATHLFSLVTEPKGQAYWDAAYATAAVLIIIIIIINFSVDFFLTKKLARKFN
jgi:phosphate transport system permease protein